MNLKKGYKINWNFSFWFFYIHIFVLVDRQHEKKSLFIKEIKWGNCKTILGNLHLLNLIFVFIFFLADRFVLLFDDVIWFSFFLMRVCLFDFSCSFSSFRNFMRQRLKGAYFVGQDLPLLSRNRQSFVWRFSVEFFFFWN